MRRKNLKTIAVLTAVGVTAAGMTVTAFAAPGQGTANGSNGSTPSGMEAGMQPGGMPNGERPELPSGEAPSGERPELPDGEAPNGPARELPDGAQPGEMPDGIPVEGIQNVISTIEDETARSSVQDKLDAYVAALDAERDALDAGNLTEEEAEELRSSVEAARTALNEALEAVKLYDSIYDFYDSK